MSYTRLAPYSIFALCSVALSVALPAHAEVGSPSQADSQFEWRPPDARDQRSDADRGAERKQAISDAWMLSLQAATHAPVDVGFVIGFEAPFRVRLSGGYGWIPPAYLNLVTNAAANASGADPRVATLIHDGFQSGHAWRIQAGIRPFSQLGLYLDAGYSRIGLSGALDDSLVPEAGTYGVSGGYQVKTALDLWLVELGYEGHIGPHVLLAVGMGVMGTFDANTSVSLDASSRKLPAIGSDVTSEVDRRLKQYGYIPTLSLRLGYDLI